MKQLEMMIIELESLFFFSSLVEEWEETRLFSTINGLISSAENETIYICNLIIKDR